MADTQETAAQSLASISASLTDPALTNLPSILSPAQKKRFRSPEPGSIDKSLPLPPSFGPTGAAEMAEAKRRRTAKEASNILSSKNPAVDVLQTLAASQPTSKASDAPTSTASPITTAAPSESAPEATISSAQTSPTTVASLAGSLTSTQPARVASPTSMEQDETEANGTANKAFSYPGPLISAQIDLKRGMSLPGSASRDNAKSPANNKKHKCPYCETEFTRHHNLKSHLLTHSQEKPYLCQTCDSRFRRLHDLKRHTKLHTGERPHICLKCNRKFARGDALARHAKGQGGCAGRRSSVGEYGDEDSMEGMVYTDNQSNEPEHMEEDEASGSSVPSIRHHAPLHPPYRQDTSSAFAKGGSTYPPIAARANMGGGLHPPNNSHTGSAPSAGQYSGPYPPVNSGSGVFPTSQMTESPKPLSPGILHPTDHRDRSSSMNQPYGRRGTRNTPPPSLPPPATGGTQLPSLPGLAPPESRYVLHSTPGGSGPSPTLPHPASGGFPPHSASNSLSSHGTGHHGSGERGTLPFLPEERLWAVIKSLESKVDRLEDEVRSLRSQLATPSQTMAPGPILPPPIVR